jgi:hypothetical protein
MSARHESLNAAHPVGIHMRGDVDKHQSRKQIGSAKAWSAMRPEIPPSDAPTSTGGLPNRSATVAADGDRICRVVVKGVSTVVNPGAVAMSPLIDCKCRVSGIGDASRGGAPGMPCLAPAMQQHDRIAVNLAAWLVLVCGKTIV